MPPSNKVILYNKTFPASMHPLAREFYMIENGGRWPLTKYTGFAGNGLFFHYKAAMKIIWPDVVWHKWLDLFLENYLTHRTMAVLGPASSGKTFCAAICALIDYYVFPSATTVIVCSTTKERLEDRVWGEIKRLHKQAVGRFDWLSGHLIEGRQRIITSDYTTSEDGRDFRNGLVGVAAKKGENFVGLGEFAGIKNKRVRLFGDEIHLLPRVFVDAISNLDKNPDFKCVGLGNPKDTTDALGVLAEPAAHLGGWEGGIDQGSGTKQWETRRPKGCALQFPGSDSPNLDGKLGIPLITQEAIDRDIAFYGKDSLWFTMMDEGKMPRGQGSKRVLTRQLCDRNHAKDEPIWANSERTKIAFCDAAYGGVGGDRCIFGELDFGNEMPPLDAGKVASTLVNQPVDTRAKRQIIHLVDHILVPVNNQLPEPPADQIAKFCMDKCKERGIPPENFFFDSGMRTALVLALARLWSPQVMSLDFGGRPTERKVSYELDVLACDYYSKRVTELWWAVRLCVESGQFRGMTEDAMMEFCQREWGMVGANKIEVEPKDKMKLKTGRSPDIADGIACGIEGAIQRGFVIRKLSLGNPDADEKDDRWRRDLREKSGSFWKAGQLQY